MNHRIVFCPFYWRLRIPEVVENSAIEKPAEPARRGRGVCLRSFPVTMDFVNESGEKLILVKINDNSYVWANETGKFVVLRFVLCMCFVEIFMEVDKMICLLFTAQTECEVMAQKCHIQCCTVHIEGSPATI